MVDSRTEQIEGGDSRHGRQKPDNAQPEGPGRQHIPPSHVPVGQGEQQKEKHDGQQLFLEIRFHRRADLRPDR